MGAVCTRACRFCAVNQGKPEPLDPEEPDRIVNAARQMRLGHVVLTSVNRDDLLDQGAGHFAAAVEALRRALPHIVVEVLTPDFQGRQDCIEQVVAASPAIYNHNVETVPALYKKVRPGSRYERSLGVLSMARQASASITTKSGLMLGLGETEDQVLEVLRDLRCVQCDFLTLGQYLRPSRDNLPVQRYVTPEEFEQLAAQARDMGFKIVHAGPLVRSSYHAGELAEKVGP
jgi:lipoyl synthase